MPTRNRRRFVSQALWYFLRQDYPRKELVVVDDGEDAIGDLIPEDDRIRYTRLERPLSIGAKRNLACRLSRGTLIAHWDDDDWMAPHRISYQVRQLQSSSADLCGSSSLLHYWPEAGEAWLYRWPENGRRWLAGGTLLYRRSAWAEQLFPDIDVGEDHEFIRRLEADRLHDVSDSSFYIALIHAGNTASKNLHDSRWQQRSLSEVSRLIGFDRDFYVALRNGRSSLSAEPASAATITVAAPFMVYDGYGSMAEYLVLGMSRAGAKVNVIPLDLDEKGTSAEFRQILAGSRPDQDGPVVYFCWPRPDLERFWTRKELFINTMWESNQLPVGWSTQLNRARAVIVPTRFVARTCRDSGVRVPIEVIPEGIDPEIYGYLERGERETFTTLIVGTVVGRKHTEEGIAAWKLAFAGDPSARLIIKSRFNYGNYLPDDPRIRFLSGNESTRGIAHWYHRADVLLALGNEGFGLPLVEGMGTGLPVIALNSEGQADVCDEAGALVLAVDPAGYEPYDDPPFGRCGFRGVPGIEEVASRLRWVADHRDEARDMGRAASEWALKHRRIWTKGPAVVDALERHSRPKRTLRRRRMFWVPSWRSACGIAEYTRHLVEAMGAVAVTRDPRDLRCLRLLHVQHEPSLFDDALLSHYVQQARHAKVPIAITEHAVGSAAQSWEREADALVATTEEGARLLRRRWPGKRVEWVPQGCPAWFPPRKRARERVIGCFGFLERHKGFWKLLEVLRALTGTELLMFSHARSTETERKWREAARGLPVRHERGFLRIDEIARRLAAEADALVFWYDETSRATASAAVRVGLATGVPTLTSPTGWFRDVRGVTYQPARLREGVERILEDTALRNRLAAEARVFCEQNSWSRIADQHTALWNSLETS